MDEVSRAVALAGLLMFVFGLALGFVLQALPNPRAALSAHLNAVQSGTFLIALALLWPKLAIWTRLAAPLGHATWIAFWALEAGMVVSGFAPPPGQDAPAGPMRRVGTGLQAFGSLVMVVTLVALLFTFGPLARPG